MLTGNIDEIKIENVEMEGSEDAKIQWLITKKQGAFNYAMRRFILGKNGFIPKHQHPWEHEIYVLKGEGIIGAGTEEKKLGPNNFAYIPPDIPHWYKSSSAEWVFLCIIPYRK